MKERVINLPAHVKYLSSRLFENGIEIYLVGGYVRNSLLSLEVTDLDITSKATPGEIIKGLKKCEDIFIIEKALDFGTIQIDLNYGGEKYSFEHTTFRHDFYHDDGSHRPKHVTFTDNIVADAQRRDFTINAIYYHVEKESLIDPLGGIIDLDQMVIKAVKENPRETLSDDGLRILRMVRFAAELNFKIDPQLFIAAKTYVSYLKDISAERKYIELKKIMLADVKYIGYNGAFKEKKHKRGIIIMNEIGALKYTFSCLQECVGVMQNPKYHKHDVFGHLVESFANSEPDLIIRFSALFHDVAKPYVLNQAGNMYGHDIRSSEMSQKMLKELKAPKAVTHDVSLLVKNHMFDLESKAKPNTIKKKAGEIGFDYMFKLAKLRRADFIGSGRNAGLESAESWENTVREMREQKTPESIRDLAINGNDLISMFGLTDGKRIGYILKKLWDLTLLKPSQNKRELLLKHANNIMKQVK